MRVLALIAAFPFLIAPALAQSPDSTQQQVQTNANAQTVQQQVRDNLQQAGFTDIQIMPSSFLVRAKDRAGNPVMMVINPDSVTAVTQIPGSSQRGAGSEGPTNVPSAQNSGAGVPGKPGNKSGPAAKSPSATTGSGMGPGTQPQDGSTMDTSKIPGQPGNKSGPAVQPPSVQAPK